MEDDGPANRQRRGVAQGLVTWMALTIDCPDPDVMADFYTVLLGGEVTRRIPGEVNMSAPSLGLLLNFRAVPDYRAPTWPSPEVPQQSHFDYVVEDPETVVKELVPMGGRLAPQQDPGNSPFVVMLDPAGHPFCLIRRSAARRY